MADKEYSQLECRLIGQIVDRSTKDIIGYVQMSSQGEVASHRIDQAIIRAEKGWYANADIQDGKIHGTECSLTRLPVYDAATMQVIDNAGITILGVARSRQGNTYFEIMDHRGRMGTVPEPVAIALAAKTGCVNGKLVTKNGKRYISAIRGEFRPLSQSRIDTINRKEAASKAAPVGVKLHPLDKSSEQKKKVEKFTREAGNARYLGQPSHYLLETNAEFSARGTMVREAAINVYEVLLSTRKLKSTLEDSVNLEDKELAKLVYMQAFGAISTLRYIKKLVHTIQNRKFGAKVKAHYPTFFAYISKEIGSVNEAVKSLVVTSEAFNQASYMTRGWSLDKRGNYIRETVIPLGNTAIKALELYDKFLVDYLNYKREALTFHLKSQLYQVLKDSPAARTYIKLQLPEFSVEPAIKTAITAASRGRIDSIAQAMYLTALEFCWMYSMPCGLTSKTKKTYIQRRVAAVAMMVRQEPVAIKSKSDSGALLFQAMAVAIAG